GGRDPRIFRTIDGEHRSVRLLEPSLLLKRHRGSSLHQLVVVLHMAPKGGRCSGLAIDVKNEILFAGCRAPQMMVILSAADGKILDALPIGSTADSAIFNPETNEAYSAQIDGTLTIIKETSPTSFAKEQ